MSSVDTFLFDIGGVLTFDGHDTYLSHPLHGIALDLGFSEKELSDRTKLVFRKYAVKRTADDTEFWQEIGAALNTSFSPSVIDTVKSKVRECNQETGAAFALLKSRNIKIGIISNSTPFFYPIASGMLPLKQYIGPELLFLSHVEGKLKSNGLFEIAASKVVPSTTFILDDRIKNVHYARQLGFGSAVYTMTGVASLLEAVDKYSRPHPRRN